MNPATVRKLCKEAESRRRRSDRVIATATELGTPVRGEPDRSSYGPSNGCGRADFGYKHLRHQRSGHLCALMAGDPHRHRGRDGDAGARRPRRRSASTTTATTTNSATTRSATAITAIGDPHRHHHHRALARLTSRRTNSPFAYRSPRNVHATSPLHAGAGSRSASPEVRLEHGGAVQGARRAGDAATCATADTAHPWWLSRSTDLDLADL
jgi:hypothetical protein